MLRMLGIALILLATGVSVLVGTRAIISTANAVSRKADEEAAANRCDTDNIVEEVVGLVRNLTPSDSLVVDEEEPGSRDPMTPYVPPKVVTPPKVTRVVKTKPRKTFNVMALVLDGDPAAVIRYGGQNFTVRVGDTVGDGVVRAIDPDGVTIETPSELKKYAYVLDN